MQIDYIESIPVDGSPHRANLRNHIVKRTIYVLESTEDWATFEALDPDTGALPLAIGFNQNIFWLDLDLVTAEGDGVSTIRTADGYVYTVRDYDCCVRSVKARDLATPPTSGVEFSDSWIVPAGATDEWADYENYIAMWTGRGWQFIAPRVGMWVLVEEPEEHFVRFSAVTGWTPGPGGLSHDVLTVPLSAAINFGYRVIVQNQTTDAPPASPAVGVAYVIGPTPTGVWAGHSKKIAICEATGEWSIYTPPTGGLVFDLALGLDYRWTGTAWRASSGVVVGAERVFTASGSSVYNSNTNYGYSSSVAPTTSNNHNTDDVPLPSYAASAACRWLEFGYQFDSVGSPVAIGLFRDNESAALDWCKASAVATFNCRFTIPTPGTAAHVYKIKIFHTNLSTLEPTRRTFTLKEIV